MGYTHYFHGNGDSAINKDCLAEIQKLLDEGWEAKIIAEESDKPDNPPIVTPESIQFNGIGEGGHETFLFNIRNTGFDFCKTAFKVYDEYVTKTLLLLKHFHPDIKLSSDGEMDGEDWALAREWMEGKYPGFKMPTKDPE